MFESGRAHFLSSLTPVSGHRGLSAESTPLRAKVHVDLTLPSLLELTVSVRLSWDPEIHQVTVMGGSAALLLHTRGAQGTGFAVTSGKGHAAGDSLSTFFSA